MFTFGKPDVLKMTHQLHHAVRTSNATAVARALLKGGDANMLVTSNNGYFHGNAYHAFASVQQSAFDARDIDVMRQLDFSNADINLPNRDGRTPLHLVVNVQNKSHASLHVVKAFLGAGATAHVLDSKGWTPLHIICADATSDADVRKLIALVLLDHGARIDEKMQGGITPLMLAAASGHANLYALLVQKGANIHAKDMKGLRASDYARGALHYALAVQIKAGEDAAPESTPSFDSTMVPKVEWIKLAHDKIARTTIEDPVQYKLTEIFNFRSATYTCITQNLYTKAEAVTVRMFDELGDNDMIVYARIALERQGGRIDNSNHGLRTGAMVKLSKRAAKDI